jgi:hypothetical protein
MTRIVPKQEFIDYLMGKSIAVVGNARAIGERGTEIDSHDIVIRFNDFVTEGYEKFVGTKTNIWCHHHGYSRKNTKAQHDYQWYSFGLVHKAESGYCLKFEYCEVYINKQGNYHHYNTAKRHCDLTATSKQPLFLNADLDKMADEVWERTPDLNAWRSISNTQPSSGLRVLAWLYCRGFQFDHYGFDGLRSPHYYQIRNDQRQQSMVLTWNHRHNFDAEAKFLELMNRNKKVEAVVQNEFYKEWAEKKFSAVHNKIEDAHPNNIVAIINSVLPDDTIRKLTSDARTGRIVRSNLSTFAPYALALKHCR